MANHRGMPAALIRPTTMPTPPEANGEPSADLLEDPADGDGQGRGESNGSARRSPRRRPKPAAGEKSKGPQADAARQRLRPAGAHGDQARVHRLGDRRGDPRPEPAETANRQR